MNKHYTKMEVTNQEIEKFGPDKNRYEKFVQDTLLTNVLYQAKDEIEIKKTYNHQTDTVEYKMGLAILSIEEYDTLKRIEREYKRLNTHQTNANDSRCKL